MSRISSYDFLSYQFRFEFDRNLINRILSLHLVQSQYLSTILNLIRRIVVFLVNYLFISRNSIILKEFYDVHTDYLGLLLSCNSL